MILKFYANAQSKTSRYGLLKCFLLYNGSIIVKFLCDICGKTMFLLKLRSKT